MNLMHQLIYLVEFELFVRNERKKRKHEWESIRVELDKLKESKGKHPKQQTEEKDVAYS